MNKKMQEAKKFLQDKQTQQDRLVEAWAKTDVGAGLVDIYNSNPHKARLVASAIENQENHLKKLNETIISQAFQTTPENVLKIVRIGSANSKRSDIFTEVGLTTTDDAIYFIDMVYADAKDGKQQSANDKIYENSYVYSVGEENYVAKNGDGTTGNVAFSTGDTGVIPNMVQGSARVLLNGKLVANDTGSGAFEAFDSSFTSGTIDYVTGAVALVFASTISATTDTVTLIFKWDSEVASNYGEIPKGSLSVSKKRFNARPMAIGFEYSTMTELVLGTSGLGDVEDMLVGAIGDALSKSKDAKAIARALQIANQQTTYQFDATIPAGTGETDYSHAQKVHSVIKDIGGDIFDVLERGMVNKIIAGSRATTYLEKNKLWNPAGEEETNVGVHFAGKLGNIDVFTAPAKANMITPEDMLLTYKNPEEGLDIGLVFGVLTEISAQLTYPTFNTERNIASVEDEIVVNKNFIKKLTLTNLPVYAV